MKERIKRAGSGATQDETKLVGKKPVAKTMRRGTFTVDKKSTKPVLRDETVTGRVTDYVFSLGIL